MRTMASVVERVMDEFPDINEEARVATIAGATSILLIAVVAPII